MRTGVMLATSRGRRAGRLGAVLAAVILLQACSVELYTGLDQRQANEIVATLMRYGIPAEREAGGDGNFLVKVQKERFADAMAVLEEHGLPRREFATLGEVFKRDGLVSSPLEERAAMIYGLSQELSRTISDIDGVLSARVHLVLPENDPMRREAVPSSASVFIRHRASAAMQELLPQVKMLVANGVAGLDYERVSVVLVPVAGTQTLPATGDVGARNFLGIWLLPGSVERAMWLFFGLVGAVVALGGRLAYLQWRQRRDVFPIDTSLPVKKS